MLYAKRLSSGEFMENFANVKLGTALNILDLSMPMLNHLTEFCQPASLCRYGGGKLSADKRDKLRADLVRSKIQER